MTAAIKSDAADTSATGRISRRALLATGAATGGVGAAMLAGVVLESPPASAAVASGQTLLAALADTIIPPTDTAGAVQAGVPDFIEMMVEHWLHPDERDRFRAGIKRFDATVREAAGRPFEELPPAQRLAVLKSMASAEAEVTGGSPHKDGPFIAQVRALVIFGYYTSEVGASEELELNLAPGYYEPCHTIEPGEKAVSLGRTNAVFHLP